MKLISLITLSILFSLQLCFGEKYGKEKVSALVRRWAVECQVLSGASKQDVFDKMNKIPARTYEGACLRLCIFQKTNLFDCYGNLNLEEILKIVDLVSNRSLVEREKSREIILLCLLLPLPDDPCVKAAIIGSCLEFERTIEEIEMIYAWPNCKHV